MWVVVDVCCSEWWCDTGGTWVGATWCGTGGWDWTVMARGGGAFTLCMIRRVVVCLFLFCAWLMMLCLGKGVVGGVLGGCVDGGRPLLRYGFGLASDGSDGGCWCWRKVCTFWVHFSSFGVVAL